MGSCALGGKAHTSAAVRGRRNGFGNTIGASTWDVPSFLPLSASESSASSTAFCSSAEDDNSSSFVFVNLRP